MSLFLNVLIITLIIVVVLTIIAAIILRGDLQECEDSEGPYCPVFVCPPDENGRILPARRSGEDGVFIFSG